MTIISQSAVQVYDTLLSPKRQLKFKQPFTKEPLSVAAINDYRIAVLRKNEVLTYDIRMQKLQSTKQLKGKGKTLLVQGKSLYVGQTDSKVKVFNINDDKSETIKLGSGGTLLFIQMKKIDKR